MACIPRERAGVNQEADMSLRRFFRRLSGPAQAEQAQSQLEGHLYELERQYGELLTQCREDRKQYDGLLQRAAELQRDSLNTKWPCASCGAVARWWPGAAPCWSR